MRVLVDDLRDDPTVDLIIRNSTKAYDTLIRLPSISHLYLDNDMGLGKPEGYQILERLFYEAGIKPEKVTIVSSNPVARLRMQATLMKEGYLNRGFNFTRKD